MNKIITLGDIFRNLETEEKAFKFLGYIKDMQKEIERLNKCYCNRSDCGGRLNQENKVYDSSQQRIDKAIEYIETEIDTNEENEKTYCINIGVKEYLLDILKGSDKE